MPDATLELHLAARDEMHQAIDWYAARNLDAADRFSAALEQAFESIREAPSRWPVVEEGIRHYVLREFPYSIIYAETVHGVFVYAVAHGSRRKSYWTHRR